MKFERAAIAQPRSWEPVSQDEVERIFDERVGSEQTPKLMAALDRGLAIPLRDYEFRQVQGGCDDE